MNLNIPKKNSNVGELNNHQVRIDDVKTLKFARVREILGGYSTQELLEILVDKVIESYYDNDAPDIELLPKSFSQKLDENKIKKLLGIG